MKSERTKQLADEWLGPNDVAELLGLHRNTVVRFSDRGILPAYRFGPRRDRRYRRSEIEAFVASAKTPVASASGQ